MILADRPVHRPDARSSNVRLSMIRERPERRHPCRLTARFIVPMHAPRTSGLSMIRRLGVRRQAGWRGRDAALASDVARGLDARARGYWLSTIGDRLLNSNEMTEMNRD